MPNGHDYTREYGGHDYGQDRNRTVDCRYGCGCTLGPHTSGGPVGLDPWGECPNNPKDGNRLDGKADYEIVVTRRIRGLEKAVFDLRERVEKAEERVGVEKAEMADKLEATEGKIESYKKAFAHIAEIAERRAND